MKNLDPVKRCKKCGRRKPLSSFYSHTTTKDGHLGKCKACCIRYQRAMRAKFPELYRLRAHFYAIKPSTRERHNAWLRANRPSRAKSGQVVSV